MIGTGRRGPLVASLFGGAARVAVGMLWLAEGVLKYRAGFGAADIELVAQSTGGNSRVPWWFEPLGAFMGAASGLFGVVIPALEVLLGLMLVAGVFSRLTAFASIGTLMLYWSSDQLIAQYPVMVLLSALVIASPAAGRFGVDGWWRRRTAASDRAVE
jgi:thiosulfate dehydrogenase [quinone] large subunit